MVIHGGKRIIVTYTALLTRMMTFQIAIEFVESFLENEKKNLEESGDLCWDQVIYKSGVPYRRSDVIRSYERNLKSLPIQRDNYVRMEAKQYPPFWLRDLRDIRRRQEEAAEAATRYKATISAETPIVFYFLLLGTIFLHTYSRNIKTK
jgi:hypothetical protein